MTIGWERSTPDISFVLGCQRLGWWVDQPNKQKITMVTVYKHISWTMGCQWAICELRFEYYLVQITASVWIPRTIEIVATTNGLATCDILLNTDTKTISCCHRFKLSLSLLLDYFFFILTSCTYCVFIFVNEQDMEFHVFISWWIIINEWMNERIVNNNNNNNNGHFYSAGIRTATLMALLYKMLLYVDEFLNCS